MHCLQYLNGERSFLFSSRPEEVADTLPQLSRWLSAGITPTREDPGQ